MVHCIFDGSKGTHRSPGNFADALVDRAFPPLSLAKPSARSHQFLPLGAADQRVPYCVEVQLGRGRATPFTTSDPQWQQRMNDDPLIMPTHDPGCANRGTLAQQIRSQVPSRLIGTHLERNPRKSAKGLHSHTVSSSRRLRRRR